MDRLEKVCKKLEELMALTKKKDKVDFITENKDDKDFLFLIKYRLDNTVNTGIKKLDAIKYAMKDNRSLTYEAFKDLLLKLRDNNITGDLKKEARNTLSRGNYKYQDILEGLVTNSLALGVNTQVNKALGYELVPEFKVMLAAPIKDLAEVKLPATVEKKYDGVRCIALVKNGVCTLYTRQGRILDFPNIAKDVVSVANGEDLMFDGELITTNRTDISGICNSNMKTGYVKDSDIPMIFYVFDELPLHVFNNKVISLPQRDRSMALSKRLAKLTKTYPRVQRGETQRIFTLGKLQRVVNNYINAGDEGVIIKDEDAPYFFRRNKAWAKVKAINSTTLKVIAVTEGTGKRKGKIGALVCETECGKLLVNVGSGLSDDIIDIFTKTPPIGKYVEVLFNVLIRGRDSDKYSLFLPRYKELRIDKSEADTVDIIIANHIGAIEDAKE